MTIVFSINIFIAHDSKMLNSFNPQVNKTVKYR